MELVIQKALEFLAELIKRAMDLASVKVKPQFVGCNENPENPAFDNPVEVAVPRFAKQSILQCGVFERVFRRLV